MSTTPAILLFDDGRGDLGPLSDLRASFEQRTGGQTLVERAQRLSTNIFAAATPALSALVAERVPVLRATFAAAPTVLCINGRLHAPFVQNVAEHFATLRVGSALTAADGSVIAANLSARDAVACAESIAAGAFELPAGIDARASQLRLWTRPWDLLEAIHFQAILNEDMLATAQSWPAAERGTLPSHAHTTGPEPVHLHASARIGISVIFDTTAGAVLVDRDAEIRHGTVVTGPAFIGRKSIVADGSVIKARTAIGPHCRAAGEIGSVIFQGCSNKAHDGHLGDALVGEWVNLGAGTINSNLLNTYAEVVMRLRPESPLERSGRQFMGCIIGDHCKFAIGTRIMTGSSIGTGCMWASSSAIAGATAPFAWVTDDGERRFRFDKFMDVLTTVMARRAQQPSAAMIARLSQINAASAG